MEQDRIEWNRILRLGQWTWIKSSLSLVLSTSHGYAKRSPFVPLLCIVFRDWYNLCFVFLEVIFIFKLSVAVGNSMKFIGL